MIGEEIERAIYEASQALRVEIGEYTVGSVVTQRSGYHLFILESVSDNPPDAETLSVEIDTALGRHNRDYSSYRQGDIGLERPRVRLARPGTLLLWMRQRGKFGGQNKIPRAIPDLDLFNDLLRFTESYSL